MVPDAKPAAAAAFSPPPGAAKKAGKAEAEFKRLAGAEEKLGFDELQALCGELGISIESDPAILVVLNAMGVKSLGDGVAREQFVQGMVNLDCDSVAALKGKLGSLRDRLKSDAFFAPFWSWAYVMNCAEGQKSLTLDVAKGLTKLLLTRERFPLVAEWCAFLEHCYALEQADKKDKKAISKDTWALLLDFGRRVRPDLSGYDAEGGAWPSVIDDFCEWLVKARASGRAVGSGGGGGGADAK